MTQQTEGHCPHRALLHEAHAIARLARAVAVAVVGDAPAFAAQAAASVGGVHHRLAVHRVVLEVAVAALLDGRLGQQGAQRFSGLACNREIRAQLEGLIAAQNSQCARSNLPLLH